MIFLRSPKVFEPSKHQNNHSRGPKRGHLGPFLGCIRGLLGSKNDIFLNFFKIDLGVPICFQTMTKPFRTLQNLSKVEIWTQNSISGPRYGPFGHLGLGWPPGPPAGTPIGGPGVKKKSKKSRFLFFVQNDIFEVPKGF